MLYYKENIEIFYVNVLLHIYGFVIEMCILLLRLIHEFLDLLYGKVYLILNFIFLN